MRLFKFNFNIATPILLSLLAASCGGGGGGGGASDSVVEPRPSPSEGPGDADNIFPLSIGDTWNYRVIEDELLESGIVIAGSEFPRSFLSSFTVIDNRQILDMEASVVLETNSSDPEEQIENFFSITNGGVTNLGNNDSQDPISTAISPHTELLFPLVPGLRYSKFDNFSGQYQDDIDEDGSNETFNISSNSQVTEFTTANLVVGNIANSPVVEEDLDLSVSLSSGTGTLLSEIETEAIYSPSIGNVKSTTVITASFSPASREIIGPETTINTTTSELIGYSVDGVTRGVQPEITIYEDTTPNNQAFFTSIAYDGNRYLGRL